MFAGWRRQWIGGPRELCTWVCCKVSPSRSLPPPQETPPPPWAKFLNKASPVDRAWAVSIPFPAPVCKSIRSEGIWKLVDEKGVGGRASREGGALVEGLSTPSELQMFSSWPWGAAPQPRAFRRLCVWVSEEGITQREQPRQGGRWGRRSHNEAPGLLCWLLGLGLNRRFIR